MKELHNENIDLVVDVHIDNKRDGAIENAIIQTGKIFAAIQNPKEDFKKMKLIPFNMVC